MTVIAGCTGRSLAAGASACEQMLERLAVLGPDQREVKALDGASFGCGLYRTLPEDDFDRQPLIGGEGRWLFVVDARVDNREELAEALGIDPTTLKVSSDADILFAAWLKWELACFDRALGDIALAAWNPESRRLVLARSLSSSKPLFYTAGRGFAAFATLPQALLALPDVQRRLNLEEFAGTAAGLPYLSSETIFAGIHRVRHGHAIEIVGSETRETPIWAPDAAIVRHLPPRDHAEALRAELDRAVRAQLRRRSGPAASQLSSGRDSSAVTVSAAAIQRERGEDVIALTGAPRFGFDPATILGRLADESGLAAEAAALHPNIRHLVCHSQPIDVGRQLADLNRTHFGPVLNIRSMAWWKSLHDRAASEGAKVIVGAGTGNLSISAGGVHYLRDLLATDGAIAWARVAAGRGGGSLSRWRSVMNFTFGQRVPPYLYRTARKVARRAPNRIARIATLNPDLADRAARILSDHSGDPRPPANGHDSRVAHLLRRDIGEKQTLATWGIDLRDPTADRRLVELCLALPPTELVSATSDRPLYDRAFADRLPRAVIENRQRGYQNADWLDHFRKGEVMALFERYRANRTVGELLDFRHIDTALAHWPNEQWPDPRTQVAYGFELLRALSLAAFVEQYFPD